MVKAMAQAACDQLGADHVVSKAFGAAVLSDNSAIIEHACELFRQLPVGQRNTLWITVKSRLATATKSDIAFTDADLSPRRVLH